MKRYRLTWTDSAGHSHEERFWFLAQAEQRFRTLLNACTEATIADIWTGRPIRHWQNSIDGVPVVDVSDGRPMVSGSAEWLSDESLLIHITEKYGRKGDAP